MTEALTPGPVGRLTEPADDERAVFLARLAARLEAHPVALPAAWMVAAELSRACDHAAVYARYGAEVPTALQTAIAALETEWDAVRWVTTPHF